jgi:group I intron endonuclease
MIGIYKITSPSNKVYIGQTTNYDKRYSAYKNYKCKSQPKLYNSLEKYGFSSHSIELIKECLIEELNYYERYYQEYYDSVLNGLNLRYTATTDKSGYMSDDSKAKMSKAWENRVADYEHLKPYYFTNGQKHLAETKQKISNSLKGKKKSPEHISKLWQNQKGAKMPKRSEATKQLQSINNGKNRAVIQMDLQGNYITEYRSVMEACRILGISRNISSCCSGKLASSGGFKWKYK